jgi:hypothetical protein
MKIREVGWDDYFIELGERLNNIEKRIEKLEEQLKEATNE